MPTDREVPAMMQRLTYDRFHTHDELTALLRSWVAARPGLARLESIGRSLEGRDIWLMTLTSTDTGPAEDKPAFFVEAGIHAAEWTGGYAALHLVHRLLDAYGQDERITRLLDTRTLYVVPRLNPDGAEHVMTEGRYIRSSMRAHPRQTAAPGLQLKDVDGDGRVLFMRQPDPDGPWKVCPQEPRLLVAREPDESGGAYYRLLLEGEIEGHRGDVVEVSDPVEGIDLGQNLPTDWAAAPGIPDNAGPFAGSEPETRAVLRAVTDRPNVTGFVTCHTFGGLHLHPPLNSTESLPYPDRRVYDAVGAKAADLTGYDVMSFQDLKYDPDIDFRGGQLGWYYEQLGLFAWITEFWSPQRAAGITAYHPSRWLLDHPVEDDLRMLEWSDKELGGQGFVDWYPFDHPQLGPVELGGWDMINYWYNPPLDRVEQEVAPHTEWVVFQALCSPRLEMRSLTASQEAPGVFRVRAVVRNSGWLPTYVSHQALRREVVAGAVAELEQSDGIRLIGGESEVALGQLEGRSGALSTTTWWGHDPGTPDLAAAEWVVAAAPGTAVSVTAHHARAGRAVGTVRLPG
ncbi:carboxypeptidase [Streptomyces sp. SID5785]|uniref:M14 family metallopeptidase n=1 Tax=Streptomyces sp. SID5785 TaxID=2690309 RepID=UPI001360F729|nr:M14 family metallopeptidase [Streptomyces sp. SID5785]MZD10432.1 carboxypeptidase [Streptomyces sp. SID5785]